MPADTRGGHLCLPDWHEVVPAQPNTVYKYAFSSYNFTLSQNDGMQGKALFKVFCRYVFDLLSVHALISIDPLF